MAKPSHFLWIFGLLLLNLVLFGDVLFSGKDLVLSSQNTDLYLHFVSWRKFAFDQLKQGHLALWNPFYLCGTPFLGGFESAILYPLNWVYLFLPINLAINIGIVSHLFLAGLFTYVWVIRRGLDPMAGFLAGCIFMFSGPHFLHVYAGHLPNLCAIAWIPLIFLVLDTILESLSLKWILLGLFAVSMQILSGNPQYVFYTAIMAVVYVLLNATRKKHLWTALLGLLIIYGGASLLTAAQLWTGLQASSESARNLSLEYRVAASFSFPPENILTLVLPEFFGNLRGIHYWGRWFLWEVSIYSGVTAFVLAFYALVVIKRNERHWELTTGVIALILSMGAYTPVFHFLYTFIPGFDAMRGICKFNIFFCLFLSVLSSMGLDHLLKNGSRLKWLTFSTVLLGIILLILGLTILLSAQKGLSGAWNSLISSVYWLQKDISSMEIQQKEKFIKAEGLNASLSLFLGAATAFLLAIFLAFRKYSQKAVGFVAVLCLLELFIFASLNRPTFHFADWQQKKDALGNFYSVNPGDYRVWGTNSDSMTVGGYDIWEDEPMVLSRYARFACRSQGINEHQLYSVMPLYKKFTSILGLVRLKYLITENEDPIRIHPTNYRCLDRLTLFNQWETIGEPADSLDRLFDPSFDFHQKVLLEKQPQPFPDPGKIKGETRYKDLSTNEMEIWVDIPKAAILLVSDNFSPGWKVLPFPDSSQKNYQVVPGDYFLRAIPLSAGKHHFILTYLPTAFVIGKWVSLLSWGVYIVILLFQLSFYKIKRKVFS